MPGLVNLDFADVVAVMKDAGYAHMGIGRAGGKEKAELAAQAAIASPLLETSIDGARGVLINITSSADIDMEDVEYASSMISRAAHPDATIDVYKRQRLAVLQIVQTDEWQQRAVSQQLSDSIISPKRGTIYDLSLIHI